MVSKDGEEVPFKTPVRVANAGVKEWLKAIEGEMRRTLALLLGEAVGSTGDLATTSRDDAHVGVEKSNAKCVWLPRCDTWIFGFVSQ